MTTAPGDSTRHPRHGVLAFVGNVLWFVLSGFWLFVGYVVAGILMCITIIGIPFGIQSLKLAGFSLWPFGKAVVADGDIGAGRGCLNALWFVLAGVWLALSHVVTGLLLCLTIIGIPFGLQNFKLARLALWPFGTRAVPIDQVPPGVTPIVRVDQP